MTWLKIAAFALLAGFVSFASAHTDEYLDSLPAPNGGQIRMAGSYHLELVVTPNELTVYVTDHAGKKLDTKGVVAAATVTVSDGKASSGIKLVTAGDNILKGTGRFELRQDMQVDVSITMPDGQPQETRFKPLQKSKPAGETHSHGNH